MGITFASNVTYAPFGGLTGALYNGGMTVSNSYNHRMQPVFLTASGGAGTIYSLGYDFHWANGDNGNVYQVTNNKDGNRTQNFSYDALNRIQTAYTSGPNWGEQYTIDTWGNLIARDPVGGKQMYEPLNVGRLATAQNQFSGSFNYIYDADGNMIQNGGTHYVYDAEDRLMSAGGVNYTYDGDGKRVMKSSGTIYWGGGEDGALAETDLSGNIQQEYAFFNGKRLARVDNTNDTMHFYFADHLGSTSDVTDAVGNILEESDYYPYGGEIPIITGDTNHYKFTGKERDSESGLDEFGARYYASSLGRFTIPDWAAKPTAVPYAHYGNPQSLNLYGYVQNNPTTFGDPDGHCEPCVEEVLESEPVQAAIDQVAPYINSAIGFIAGAAIGTSKSIEGIANTLVQSGVRGEAGFDPIPGLHQPLAESTQQAATQQSGSSAQSGQSTPAQPEDGNGKYENSPENEQRMGQGKAPLDKNGKSIELHHEGQTQDGQLREMPQEEHRGGDNFKNNHPNTGQEPSKINRSEAAKARREYWKNKAKNQP